LTQKRTDLTQSVFPLTEVKVFWVEVEVSLTEVKVYFGQRKRGCNLMAGVLCHKNVSIA